MRHTLLFIAFLLFTAQTFADDLLIVGKDTFYLKTYPLESLHLKTRPFNLDKKKAQQKYPGYQAVWRIVDEKLYLEKILSVDSLQTQNISDLLNANNISCQKEGDLFFAKWITIAYYPITPFSIADRYRLLAGSYEKAYNDNALVRIENGIVIDDKLSQNSR